MAPEAVTFDHDAAMSSPRARRSIDWPAIERDYRSGSYSLRVLASKHGCSHSAIANFAGRHGWIRNPTLLPTIAGKGSPMRERLLGAGLEPHTVCAEAFVSQVTREIEANTRLAGELDLKAE